MSKDKRIFDLEERLVDFAVRIIRTAESLPKTRAGKSHCRATYSLRYVTRSQLW